VPTVVRIRGWGFALVNLPVVLVYGYGRGSCLLDFCRDVGFPDRQWVRGLGLRPFVVYPPSCRGGRCFTINRLSYHTTGWLLLDKLFNVLEAGSLAILRDRNIIEISYLWQWTMSNKCSIVTDLWKIKKYYCKN